VALLKESLEAHARINDTIKRENRSLMAKLTESRECTRDARRAVDTMQEELKQQRELFDAQIDTVNKLGERNQQLLVELSKQQVEIQEKENEIALAACQDPPNPQAAVIRLQKELAYANGRLDQTILVAKRLTGQRNHDGPNGPLVVKQEPNPIPLTQASYDAITALSDRLDRLAADLKNAEDFKAMERMMARTKMNPRQASFDRIAEKNGLSPDPTLSQDDIETTIQEDTSYTYRRRPAHYGDEVEDRP
jgi:hypothetical protein